ncbi:MAG: hypothetical protein ACI87E_001573, partial [Mariniblastus sp.]
NTATSKRVSEDEQPWKASHQREASLAEAFGLPWLSVTGP